MQNKLNLLQQQSFAHFRPKNGHQHLWEQVCNSVSTLDNNYSYAMTDYHLAYLESHCDVVDASVVFLINDQPVAIWPLNLSLQNNQWQLKSHCVGVMPPLCSELLSSKQRKQIYKQCINFITLCAKEFACKNINSNFKTDTDSNWLQCIAPVIHSITYKHILYLTLEKSLSEIKASFRKRYRSYINKGLALWQHQILSSLTSNQLEEIRHFHIRIAGKETRSRKTWLQQKDMVNNNQAFIVTLRDANKTLIAAAIFNVTTKQAMYSVGIYERALFSYPIGHTVQMLAIEHMKKIGIESYFIGYRDYEFEPHSPSEKESSIGYFKEGFSNLMKLESCAKLTL